LTYDYDLGDFDLGEDDGLTDDYDLGEDDESTDAYEMGEYDLGVDFLLPYDLMRHSNELGEDQPTAVVVQRY